MKPDLKIGDEVYRKFTWKPLYIVGETSRSWIVWSKPEPPESWQKPQKMPKTNPKDGWIIDRQEWIDWKFAKSHMYEIAECVRLTDPAMLRKVAELIGWMPCECGHGPRWHAQGPCQDAHGRCQCKALVPQEPK